MKSLVSLVLLTSLFAAGSVRAGELAPASPQPALTDSLSQQIGQELAPLIHSFTQPIALFHFVARAKVGVGLADDPFSPRGKEYCSARISEVFDHPYPTSDVMGPGLYLANDPITTKSYGTDDWAMITLTFPAGTRFLDSRGAYPFSARTRELMAKAGCSVSAFKAAFRGARCKALLRPALEAQGIELVAYTFANEKFTGCDKERSDAAFLAISAKALESGLETLTARIPSDDPDSKNRTLYANVFRSKVGGYPNPWPSLVDRPNQDEYLAWVKSHIFGCGPESLFAAKAVSNL